MSQPNEPKSAPWLDTAGIEALDTIWHQGARKAAQDLTLMSGEEFRISEVKFKKMPLADLSTFLGRADEQISTVLLEIRGDCNGDIILLLPMNSTDELVETLFSGCSLTQEEIAQNREGALREAGNILGSAFLNAVSSLTKMEIVPRVPTHAEDMLGAIMDIVQIKHASKGDEVFVAKSSLVRGSRPMDLFLLAIFERDSLEKIIEKSREYGDEG